MAVWIAPQTLPPGAWRPCTSGFTVTLPDQDGDYEVRVALRGWVATNAPVLDRTELTLDRVPPTLAITNPLVLNGAAPVVKPYLQLKGWGDEVLARLQVSVSNELAWRTNEVVAVLDQYFDTNKFDFTTNYFHGFDLPLAAGTNVIALTVADRAGNVSRTNVTVVLDWSGDETPPAVGLTWPPPGASVSGGSFYVRGKIDDETAQVILQQVSANQETKVWPGLGAEHFGAERWELAEAKAERIIAAEFSDRFYPRTAARRLSL